MIVAGIDPGSRKAGYAVLRVTGTRLEILSVGVWNLIQLAPRKERSDLGERIEILHRLVGEFLRSHNPHLIGLEKAVSFKNIESAHKLSEARGVIRLAAFQNLENASARFLELSPTAVKRQATGFGDSDKTGMMKALKLRFANLHEFVDDKTPFDAFDALGIAYTSWIHYKQKVGPVPRKLGHRMGEGSV